MHKKFTGEVFPVEVSLTAIEYNNELMLHTLLKDLTTRKQLEKQVQKANIKLERAHKHAIYMLALASEYKDHETGGHIQRIIGMTSDLATELGVDQQSAEKMGSDSVLHDLGKLGISDYILLKPGKLTVNEFKTMKQHTIIGAKIIGDDEWFYQARQIALSHHEKWDGNGYPEGLKGEEIPFAARIVAVADALDALISKRPYKESWPPKQAIAEIRKESGTHFDPKIVEALLTFYRRGLLKKYFNQVTKTHKNTATNDN